MNNRIVKKDYYAFKVRLQSPMNVSSGDSWNTDSDVIRNAQGEVYVPGTSIAGALKETLKLKENEEGIMGYTNDNDGRMSSLFISDMYFTSGTKVSIRDRIQLNKDKTVNNKFDNEIIETGAEAVIYIKCIIRQNDDKLWYKDAMHTLAVKLQKGEFRLGANKTRGYGRLQLLSVYKKSFDKDTIEDYLRFVSDEKNLENYDKQEKDKWFSQNDMSEDYITISVPLKLTGGISIRKYSTTPGNADYEHITCNGRPVIPGSSWNGVIRADIINILQELGCEQTDNVIDGWFGCIKSKTSDKDSEKGKKSLISVEESVIEGSVCMPVSRNRINRFSAATVNSALYTELSYFGGNTELVIKVRKQEDSQYRGLLAALSIVIEDISRGYVAIGGLTSIGRGILADNGKVTYSDDIDNERNMEELYSLLG